MTTAFRIEFIQGTVASVYGRGNEARFAIRLGC